MDESVIALSAASMNALDRMTDSMPPPPSKGRKTWSSTPRGTFAVGQLCGGRQRQQVEIVIPHGVQIRGLIDGLPQPADPVLGPVRGVGDDLLDDGAAALVGQVGREPGVRPQAEELAPPDGQRFARGEGPVKTSEFLVLGLTQVTPSVHRAI